MKLTSLQSFFLDYPAACESMLAKALKTKIEKTSCPHFFIENWLPGFWATCLIEKIPPSDLFNAVNGGGKILNSEDIFGYQWFLYFSLIQKLLLDQLPRFAPWWKDIMKQVNETIFGNFWDIKLEPNFICLTDPKIGVPPHTDGETSILTAITVLGYLDFTPAPVTNFYSENLFPPIPITFYPPSRNSLLFLNKLGVSKHGVAEKIKPIKITYIAGISARKT